MPSAGQTIKPQVKLGKRAEDCWVWLGSKTPDGHGKKTYLGQNVMAHRWMWEILFGPIPAGLVVYATCGTTGCTNPHHLACGFIADARRQASDAKLFPADIAEIRAAKSTASLHTAAHLAQRFDVTPGTIRDIWRGASWGKRRRHVPPHQQRVG